MVRPQSSQDGGVSDPELPTFRYHPDPLATGSACGDGRSCVLCGEARGVIYDGPIYGRQADVLCLHCIASGEATRSLAMPDGTAAEFTDVGEGVPNDVQRSVLEEVAQRTPGFRGWQQAHWLYHCGDAAEYLGRVGHDTLTEYPDALDMVLHENDVYGWTSEQSREYVGQPTPNGGATGYLFRCLHCRRALAYTDMC